jgi:hypothetical protein
MTMAMSLTGRLLLLAHFGLLAALFSDMLILGHPKWFGRASWQTIAGYVSLVLLGVAVLTACAWVAVAQLRKRPGIGIGAICCYLLALYIIVERLSLPNE